MCTQSRNWRLDVVQALAVVLIHQVLGVIEPEYRLDRAILLGRKMQINKTAFAYKRLPPLKLRQKRADHSVWEVRRPFDGDPQVVSLRSEPKLHL